MGGGCDGGRIASRGLRQRERRIRRELRRLGAVVGTGFPEREERHGQLAGDRDDGAFFGGLQSWGLPSSGVVS